MSFTHYLTVKDRICLVYTGHSSEYLVQLRQLRPFLEAVLPGVEICYACRPGDRLWLDGDPNAITTDEYLGVKDRFGMSLEITYDANAGVHPIWNLLAQSGVSVSPRTARPPQDRNAYICIEGNFPTRSLTVEQIHLLRSDVLRKGFRPTVVVSAESRTTLPLDRRLDAAERKRLAETAGCVVGVECDMLFHAANAGVPTSLVPTGLGADLYKALYLTK